jgi:hypothetical protein
MLFLSVYGFPLSLGFFLWVYVCVFPSKSASVSFLWVYGILMFLRVCVYGYTEEEKCASHKGPGRSCGGKIRFSPPPPLRVAKDCATAGLRRYRDDGDRLGDRGVRGSGVADMDRATEGIYSGDPGVDSLLRILYLISYHLIIQRIIHSIFRIF